MTKQYSNDEIPKTGDDPRRYSSGNYWSERSDLLYYRYIDYVVRTLGAEAKSLIDVGTGNCPYLEWFDWIERKVSVDIGAPYKSKTVVGIQDDIHKIDFSDSFDICLCLQVLEHVPEAERFAKRLLEMGKLVVISVPLDWPEGATAGHVHDPVNLEKLVSWTGRTPNDHIVVTEPFRSKKNKRLIAIFDTVDASRRFGYRDVQSRRLPGGQRLTSSG